MEHNNKIRQEFRDKTETMVMGYTHDGIPFSSEYVLWLEDELNNMKEVIEKLNEGLKDPEYRRGWIAGIAMAQIDCERWYREENNKVGKDLNAKDRYAIANKGAEYFLELLNR